MGYINEIKRYWPKGTPLPADGIFFFYSPQDNTEFKVLPEQLRVPASEGVGLAEVYSRDIKDATAAGIALLTAASAQEQLQLLDEYVVDPEGDYPGFETIYQPAGAMDWVIAQLRHLLSQAAPVAPAAPTGAQVDDTANTFSVLLVLGFMSLADYEVFGKPGQTSLVNATAAGCDIQNGRLYYRGLTGNLPAGSVGVRVQASGNRPAGASATNTTAFTSTDEGSTTPPINQKPQVSFSPSDSSTPTVGVNKNYLALATDQDGSIAGVELLQVQGVPAQGQSPVIIAGLASDGTSPYSLDWTPTSAGTVYLVARATDNQGAQGYSSVLTVTVQPAGGGGQLPYLVLAFGDSLTYGNDIPNLSYPTKLAGLLGAGYEVRNLGVNGQPMSNALANPSVLGLLDSQLNVIDRTKYSKIIALVDGGANDFRLLGMNYPGQDANGLTFQARKTIHQKLVAANIPAIALNHTNYNFNQPTTPASLNATIRANMLEEDARIRAYWVSELGSRGFVDLAADPKIGRPTPDASYFEADGVHLAEAGNLQKAQAILPAVQALLAGNTYGVVTPMPVVTVLTVNDTDSGFAYGPNWAYVDAAIANPEAFIYSSGTAHVSPYQHPETSLYMEYTIGRNAAQIDFCYPAQTVPISILVSVAGGQQYVLTTPAQTANESSSTFKGCIKGSFTPGQVLRITNNPTLPTYYACVDQLVLRDAANSSASAPPFSSAVLMEETDAGWSYIGPWASQASALHSAGAAVYLLSGVAGSASRVLTACASIDIWLCQISGGSLSADYYIDNVYQATLITTDGEQPSAKRLTLPGPFAAGQVLKVTNPTVAHDPNAATNYTYLDKIVLNS